MIRFFRFAAAVLTALPLVAGEPSPIEDQLISAESAWNGEGAVMQFTASSIFDARAYELAQTWGAAGGRHQAAFAIPVYSDGVVGLGDVAVSYRYQAAGGAGSRIAIAPRVTALLPTRHAAFGTRAAGVQISIPVSAALTRSLTSHSAVGASLLPSRDEREISAAQGLAWTFGSGVTVSLDALWKRCHEEESLVVRQAVQFMFDGPRGLRIGPGIGWSAGRDGGVSFSIALEQPLRGSM